jgi:hypothetical protein
MDRSGTGRRALARVVLAVTMLSSSGCCRLLLALDDSGGGADPEPAPVGPLVDFGVLPYPRNAPTDPHADHRWIALRLEPNGHRLGYALRGKEAGEIHQAFEAYARKVQYEDQGTTRFRWVPPPGCEGDIHCVFEDLAVKNRASLDPLVEAFQKRAREASLTSLQVAGLMTGFVQAIRYEIPDAEPFGVLPPALVVSEKRGDCDSKALLLHMLLHAVGIDSMMISSTAHRHTMLGIAMPVQGSSFTVAGRQYAFTETTAKGSPIGFIDPKLLRPNDWQPVVVRVPDAQPGGAAPTAPGSPLRVLRSR